MKIVKSLGLGSAAALFAISGAQAADLPIKAKPVEYVRVCSMYGAGFFYIPGTDTCIKLGGYLRAEAGLGTNALFQNAVNGPGGARNRLSNYYTTRSRADFNIDTRTATEYGVVRTFFDAVFQWTTDSNTGNANGNGSTVYSQIGGGTGVSGAVAPNNANAGAIAGGTLGVFYAFIQFAGFTMGKAVSQFDAPWSNYPGNNFDGLTGGGGSITGVNQFTYTADFGSGITAAISAQDATQYGQSQIWNTTGQTAAGVIGGNYGLSTFGGNVAPDIVGMVRVDQAWGLFQASFAAHDNHAAFFGANETTGHPADKWGFAGQLALSVKNIPTGPGDTLNIQGVYTNGASRYNFQSLAPINYAMYGSSNLAGAYQSLGFAGVSDSVFGAGTQQQLTTTYGFRGAFTHNWDPFWNSAVYGSWSAVRYNGTAKGLICNGAGMVALGITGANCNPDFNISTLGVITRWTPVKNLTFSADVAWTRLDQKFAGVATAPAAAAVAKPATTYQLKDQDSVSLLLRAQRNW
ncbi:polymerase [Bradyrhizobium sp. SSBR45G]|uniref:porin n=1 Tax=unclassified Bradyrhizobium TaxID=2631580 RepID=UPI002342998B|nr:MULTISPECIES: porin [unclassified Bradyrhizobium]GLH75704.1 polymerase [Bradyrhizobium sp. SSBR45G]GLH85730.1 polymerase [Bradyrhizobium sp. SSBR45R]